MAFDNHANFGYALVLIPPIPAISGTTLTLAAGGGALLPAAPFNATVWPTGAAPFFSNAEIVRVTSVIGDTITILRAQEGSNARAILAGDQFANTITVKVITDIENALGDYVTDAELAAWPGSTNIITLGTIATGVWQGTPIGDTYIASAATWNAHLANINNPHSTSDANLVTNDIATNNATTLKHGFLPKLSGSATQFLDGQGNFATISAIVAAPPGFTQVTFSGQTSVTVTHNFGFYPLVQVLDASGSPLLQIPLNVTHTSVNSFTVTFSSAQSGTIIASVGSPQIPNVITTSSNYAVLTGDNIIVATAFNITITLPTAVGVTGKTYSIDNNSTGSIFVTGLQTIQNQTIQIVPSQSAMTVYSTGAVWRII